MDADLLLAIQLQEQFDREQAPTDAKKRRVDAGPGPGPGWQPPPHRPLSIVDASWETLDPSPDVRAMFLEFNDTFFWGKLSGVEVKWSARMTLCAGVCSYEGRGGLCSIRLSEPLLKLRPRRDLVETLLHEMIHALLFVTQNNRDRDGHGPEFCKHMRRINSASGTNITVYHDFHDEVDAYRQHWWRCDGPCQARKPYLGYVKRAMNRAPSRLDPWWADHQRTCGGTFTKVKEPDGYGKKGKKGGRKDEKVAGSQKAPSAAAGQGQGQGQGSGSRDIRTIIPFSGTGFLLGGRSSSSQASATGSPAPSPLPSSPKAAPSLPPVTSAGPEGGRKRSVGNTRAFVSINGSPVRIQRPGRAAPDATRQRSIQDLFCRKPDAPPATSTQPAPTAGPSGDGTSRKRPRGPGDSAAIFDYFQKRLSDASAAASGSAPSPSPPQHPDSASSPTQRPDSASVTTVSRAMVRCPVCQHMILESSINQHLDSCLSAPGL